MARKVPWTDDEISFINLNKNERPDPIIPNAMVGGATWIHKNIFNVSRNKRTLNAVIQRISKLESDNAVHKISVTLANSNQSEPQVPQNVTVGTAETSKASVPATEKNFIEEVDDDDYGSVLSKSIYSRRSKSNIEAKSPEKRLKLDLEVKGPFFVDVYSTPQPMTMFQLEKVELGNPFIFPIDDSTLKVVFQLPIFGIKITAYKLVKKIILGIKYHITCPTREDVKSLVNDQTIAERWVCTHPYTKLQVKNVDLGKQYDKISVDQNAKTVIFTITMKEDSSDSDW